MDKKDSFRKWELDEDSLIGLTNAKALDILVECFYAAQGGLVKRIKNKLDIDPTDKQILDQVVALIRMAFKEVGEDFSNPTKIALTKVIERLSEKAKSWGTPQDIIDHHRKEIQRVIDHLKE